MTVIEQIENVCKNAEVDAVLRLMQIKKIIESGQKPDFSTLAPSDRFTYHDIEFIYLGEEQGGYLCIVANPIGEIPFDETEDNNERNNWKKSTLRKFLNGEFLEKLNADDLMDYTSDLTADNGDKSYGTCTDKVGLLSCDLYRKYRDIVPTFSEWMWTCTPWVCRTPYRHNADHVRHVNSDGSLDSSDAGSSYGVVPACIFHP